MPKLEDWVENQRKQIIDDPAEALRIIMSQIDKNSPIYRLELLYDKENNAIILQGNSAGLNHLLQSISRIARLDAPIGEQHEYDRYSGLTKCDFDLIIKRVGEID